MTPAGILFMALSVGAVTALFIWCLWKVLSNRRPAEHLAHVEPVERDELGRR